MPLPSRRSAALLVAALGAAASLFAPVAAPTPSTSSTAASGTGTIASGTGQAPTRPVAVSSTPTGVVELKGHVYGSAPRLDGRMRDLRMDLWLPTGVRGARPTILLVHGGGFVRGSRKQEPIRRMADTFARRGYVAASVSYRLTPTKATRRAIGPDLPNSVAAERAQHDLQAAVRYLRMRAGRYRVDRSRIAVVGGSAGGVTALRVAFNPEDPGESGNPGYRSRVAAAVSLWGNGDRDMIEPGAPPALMFHGREDELLPFWSARRTCMGVRRDGDGICKRVWWDETGHAPWHRLDQVERVTLRFLDKHLA